MRVAFLGLGQMGLAIAKHLLEAKYELTVWNRSAPAAEPMRALGARIAGSAREAVADAEVVFTMLHDDAALRSVLLGEGAGEGTATIDAIPRGATHVSLATISVELARELEREHAKRGQQYVASPVFGRPGVAEQGKLWLAVAGAPAARERVQPLLSLFSRGATVVGDQPSAAHALKIGGNFLITAMIASLSEAITFAEGAGIASGVFFEAINSALFQSPFYATYGKIMLDPPATPGATIELGIKDAGLFLSAAQENNVPTPLAALFREQLQTAADAGLAHADWAAGYLQQVRRQAAHRTAHHEEKQ